MQKHNPRWREGHQLIERDRDGHLVTFTFEYDWSKVMHIKGSQYIITGGLKNEPGQEHLAETQKRKVYTNNVWMLDINTGIIAKKKNMNFNRQAHGMAKIGDYVYC